MIYIYVAEEETVGQRDRWAVTLQHHKLGPVISAILHSSIQYTQYSTQIHCTTQGGRARTDFSLAWLEAA